MRRTPWARPTSTPRSNGDTPVLYAGRLDRKPATRGEEVTGVSSMPMKGSPLMGWTTCQDWGEDFKVLEGFKRSVCIIDYNLSRES